MTELIWDKSFVRSYRKRISTNQALKEKFIYTIKEFSQDPFSPKLKTHKLSGTLKNCWAFSVDLNYRVIFKFIEQNKVLLIDIGTHEEVY